jgi:Na+/pantothenate symporter
MRSGFIPRFLGVLLIIAGPGYLASSFGGLVLPQYAPAIDRVARILTLAELPIIFWLLIWGAPAAAAIQTFRSRAPVG